MVEVSRPVTDPQIEIDGELYPLPLVGDLDLNEEEILYDISGVIIPDFMPAPVGASEEIQRAVALMQAARVRNPRFKRALCVIAYLRKHPEIDLEAASERIGKVGAFDAELALYGKAREAEEEDAESP
jgi:hypothetical protein